MRFDRGSCEILHEVQVEDLLGCVSLHFSNPSRALSDIVQGLCR